MGLCVSDRYFKRTVATYARYLQCDVIIDQSYNVAKSLSLTVCMNQGVQGKCITNTATPTAMYSCYTRV